MVLLCAIWGLQQVAVKVAGHGISPVAQVGVRSALAAVLVYGWALFRGIPLFGRDRSLWPGLLTGVLFAVEFAAIFAGAQLTSVSRLVVFIYLAPCLTVLGLHLFVPGERMNWQQASGVALAFFGLVVAFAETGGPPGSWLGDLYGLIGAFFWAATTVAIRMTVLARLSATKVLFYQLAVSGLIMLPLSWLLGERGLFDPTPEVLVALAYQTVIVAFLSYLAWFWLLARYQAGRLMVFSFLTPLFGVGFGVALMGDAPSLYFAIATLMVVAGIVLVNRRGVG
jgi:drug/metabolite transporter (DMT)-like permease